MNREKVREENWLESWLAEGNSIESSEYFAEKGQADSRRAAPVRRSKPRRARRNAYIVNRAHKRKMLSRCVIERYGEESYDVYYMPLGTPYHVYPSPRCVNRYVPGGDPRRCWDAIECMIREEGRVLPDMVYVENAGGYWIRISPDCRRFIKKWSNRAIRRYGRNPENELHCGRHAFRLTSRGYHIVMDW